MALTGVPIGVYLDMMHKNQDKEIKERLTNLSTEELIKLVSTVPYVISYLDNPSKILQKISVEFDNSMAKHINNMDPEFQVEMATKYPKSIRYFQHPTFEALKAAVSKNPGVISSFYLKSEFITQELCDVAFNAGKKEYTLHVLTNIPDEFITQEMKDELLTVRPSVIFKYKDWYPHPTDEQLIAAIKDISFKFNNEFDDVGDDLADSDYISNHDWSPSMGIALKLLRHKNKDIRNALLETNVNFFRFITSEEQADEDLQNLVLDNCNDEYDIGIAELFINSSDAIQIKAVKVNPYAIICFKNDVCKEAQMELVRSDVLNFLKATKFTLCDDVFMYVAENIKDEDIRRFQYVKHIPECVQEVLLERDINNIKYITYPSTNSLSKVLNKGSEFILNELKKDDESKIITTLRSLGLYPFN